MLYLVHCHSGWNFDSERSLLEALVVRLEDGGRHGVVATDIVT